jgi:hypothetical protein
MTPCSLPRGHAPPSESLGDAAQGESVLNLERRGKSI